MPGLVVFRRRWSVGSDDLVVPGVFLFTLHSVWLVVVIVLLSGSTLTRELPCVQQIHTWLIVYLVLLATSLALELSIAIIAMRGTILDSEPRASMPYVLYTRLTVLLLDMVWLGLGVAWLVLNYVDCPIQSSKDAVLGLVVCNLCVLGSVGVTIWCTFDAAGRSWVKMKKYQQSMKQAEAKFQYRRSGSRHRNWRQRKVIRAYQDSWDNRCRLLFCCMGNSDRSRNSFADIAKLLSDFFRDLDVVPSDVVAGLVLLRKCQKLQREAVVAQRCNDTYEFLSGVPVNPRTEFVALGEPDQFEEFMDVIHYMRFALGAYGWPMFLVTHSSCGVCRLCANLRCTCCSDECSDDSPIMEDNCCRCNIAALKEQVERGDVEVVYATFHVDVGQTPFFVAVDYARRKVVLSIRGTLSMKDIITDLNAEAELLPLTPPRDGWLGHKGMVQAAAYIRDKIHKDGILARAFSRDPSRGTHQFELVLVGHSLGAGTAAILAILLRQEHPGLRCFAFSPPGGLLSLPAMEYSQEFTISVVVGKDVVPRIGLHQLEALRADLINAIKQSQDPKWHTIASGVICCCHGNHHVTRRGSSTSDISQVPAVTDDEREAARDVATHPSDSSIALTVHQPMYPPGRIMHIVRHHPTKGEQVLGKNEPVYQALWANNTDFNQVLISPVMIQDHMPDTVLEALNKVMTNIGPAKPQRISSPIIEEMDSSTCPTQSANFVLETEIPSSPKSSTPPHKLCLETSFTSLSPDQPSRSPIIITPINHTSPLNPNIPWEYTSILDDNKTITPSNETKNIKIDLIHDDWFGLAPLATPESLSEVSSISSRTGSLLQGLSYHYPMLFSPRLGKKVGPVVYTPACLKTPTTNSSISPSSNLKLPASESGGIKSEEIESSLYDSIELSFESSNTTTPTHNNKKPLTYFNNNNFLDEFHISKFNHPSPKQVTFTFNNNHEQEESLTSAMMYFVETMNHHQSPTEDEDDSGISAVGTANSGSGLSGVVAGTTNINTIKDYMKSDHVAESSLPILNNLAISQTKIEYDNNCKERLFNGESSV